MKKNIAGKFFSKNDPSPAEDNQSKEIRFNEIIEGCKEHDKSSQEELYKQFYGYALGVALTYSSTREDAVEVVNDSFMKVFKHIKRYKTSEPFKPWFRKIVVNTAIDKARSNKRFRNHYEIEDLEHASAVNIEADLNAKQIFQMLNELPELLRYVFNMYEIEGYSHREIGKKLDIAESSSRTYLTRAKTKLRQLYENNFMNGQ